MRPGSFIIGGFPAARSAASSRLGVESKRPCRSGERVMFDSLAGRGSLCVLRFSSPPPAAPVARGPMTRWPPRPPAHARVKPTPDSRAAGAVQPASTAARWSSLASARAHARAAPAAQVLPPCCAALRSAASHVRRLNAVTVQDCSATPPLPARASHTGKGCRCSQPAPRPGCRRRQTARLPAPRRHPRGTRQRTAPARRR